MIVLNNFAEKCVDVCLKSKRVSHHFRAFLYQASAHINIIYDMTKWADARLPQWSEYEVACADAILWLMAFLKREGCKNIDKLLKDVADYRDEHPDIRSRD